jgi:hypothetical protein
MFIGHVAGAELLHVLFPETPVWVGMVGVSFPDLLWGVTIFAGIERVEVDPKSPLQSHIRFVHYPYSHSLVLTNLIALIPAAIIGAFLGWQAALVFVLASISHWLLDVIVHLPDLPVLGFGRDSKVGFGLWRYGWAALIVEYALFAAATLAFVPSGKWAAVLIAGLVLHAINLNTFLGLTKDNPFKTGKVYAAAALGGYIVLIVVFTWLLS